MSRTSELEVEALTGRALQAGMKEPELRAWRRALDPVALDTCGCKASAKAAAVVGVLAAAVSVLSGERAGASPASLSPGARARASFALAATLASALLVKLLGMRAGRRRRARLLRILDERIREVAATTSSP
jgi:ABC-type nitrate/sulfonate/bicarbonate transport system ATPase subunit